MQLALVAGLVVAACAPLIGAFLVEKQLSLLGDGLGHLAFAGVAVGLLLAVSPLWAALVVTVVGALALELLRVRGKASGDLVLALFFYGGIAAGAVIASRATAEGQSVNVLPYLFGSILTVTPNDVWLVVGLGVVIVASIAVTGRAMFAIVRRRGVGAGLGPAGQPAERAARRARRGHDRRRDPGRRHAARRRAHGAAGGVRPAARALVPDDGRRRGPRRRRSRSSPGSWPRGSGRSRPAARSSSWPRRCSRSSRSRRASGAPASATSSAAPATDRSRSTR